MSTWITAYASVIGSSHKKSGYPCQDASIVKISPDGRWLVIVVSDGAGTAAKAEIGSRHVSAYFADELLKLVQELQKRAPGHWINDFVISKVLETRSALRNLAKSDDIRDYNCTLVACLLGPSGGFSIHIGDGSVIGGSFADLSDSTFLSPPENGEYSNETYFITEGDWVKHLRVMPMPKLDWVLCCTDGGGDIALITDKEPKNGFLRPVLSAVFQENEQASRNDILRSFLENPQADKATSDDKTIVFAIKDGFQSNLMDSFLSNKELQIPIAQSVQPSISKARENEKSQRQEKSLTAVSRGILKNQSRNKFSIGCFIGLFFILSISFIWINQFDSLITWFKSKFNSFVIISTSGNPQHIKQIQPIKAVELESKGGSSAPAPDVKSREKIQENLDQKGIVNK